MTYIADYLYMKSRRVIMPSIRFSLLMTSKWRRPKARKILKILGTESYCK